ncbi:hypothetical protein BKA70DRAFT_1462767 [Coprinopsis sp. MPI-PUGE-AT-0042]|nr:hypothetical protein BKA70DRAFT_1462767 [Coprinopsis sp. MPI-PUGE-AT-0042]
MLDAFVTRDSTKALSRALQGIVGGDKDEEDEEEHEDPVVQEDKPKKKGGRKGGDKSSGKGKGRMKAARNVNDDIQEVTKRRGRGRGVVLDDDDPEDDFPADKVDDQSMDDMSQGTTSSTTGSDNEDLNTSDINMGSPREPPESESEPEDEQPPAGPMDIEPNCLDHQPPPSQNGEDDMVEHSLKTAVAGSKLPSKSTNKRPRAPSSPPAPSKNTSTTNSRPTSPMSAPPAKIKKKVPVNPMTSTHTTAFHADRLFLKIVALSSWDVHATPPPSLLPGTIQELHRHQDVQSLPHLALEPHQQFIQDSLMVVGLAKLLVNPLPQEQGGRAGIPLENSGEISMSMPLSFVAL